MEYTAKSKGISSSLQLNGTMVGGAIASCGSLSGHINTSVVAVLPGVHGRQEELEWVIVLYHCLGCSDFINRVTFSASGIGNAKDDIEDKGLAFFWYKNKKGRLKKRERLGRGLVNFTPDAFIQLYRYLLSGLHLPKKMFKRVARGGIAVSF
ncbi:LOW QUALITY PROTEIN: hypothetical protein M8C21_024592 [Ambrosia artemisiifolia]|uniref:Uncharacterized protein n=1 Tax=Ambrosia artemisiifolia TaxID=4212 RepID=A0AAD5D4S1_AMBAR|nr:LOW QUALITY PROTEIN: hypothetical protein M8C21_024592 [Ambrosia artemisiifolia]